ncbi:MAG: HAD family hydrolase, partial [Deltaproteobacteria bacterium]|nr:HAD family hydrolase [Deltaproteobacteria bacterium]
MCKDFKGAVFLDRDGTISEEVGYISNLDQFQLMPKSAEAVKLMNERGLKVIVVTNQAGVAKGYFPEEMVSRVHKKMEKILSDQGAFLDGIYYCPHHPEGIVETYRKKCECRKPASGLLRQASEEHGIDISSSYMVGDKMADVECAHQIGVKGVLVLTGYGKDELKKIEGARIRRPEYVADDIF